MLNKIKLILIFLFLAIGCNFGEIDPNKTYTVYTITDFDGKKYYNLCPDSMHGENSYRDIDGNKYVFFGNYTRITSQISGLELLRSKKGEKE